MASQSLSDRLSQVWSTASAQWKGQVAEAFYQYYILRLQESAQQQDRTGRVLAEEIQTLSDAIDAIEAELYA